MNRNYQKIHTPNHLARLKIQARIPKPGPKLPLGRTLQEFQPLNPAEAKLLETCGRGVLTSISAHRPTERSANNIVTANFLRFLILGGDEHAPVHEHGIQLHGAWIEGELQLKGCNTRFDLRLTECHFESQPRFNTVQMEGDLVLTGSSMPGMSLNRATIKGDVYLNAGFTASSEVQLLGTQIMGDLVCSGAKFDDKEGDALSADGMVVKGNVLLSAGFTAHGNVRLPGAHIGSNLDCSGAAFDGKTGDALTADGIVIKGNAFLSDKFSAAGNVRLSAAQIDGSLDCSDGKFDGKQGAALWAHLIIVKGNVILAGNFTARGGVLMLGAQIGGHLVCRGANFDGRGGAAFSADGIVIKGNAFLTAGFTTSGEVRLMDAKIGGTLECEGARFDGKSRNLLICDGMHVAGALMFRGLTHPVRGVSLASAKVGRLVDDEKAWGQDLDLDGFVYEHLAGGAPVDARSRLAWLEKQRPDHAGKTEENDFRPQPWEQLQKVLRAMGHGAAAKEIGMAFEDRLRHSGVIARLPHDWPWWKRKSYGSIRELFHWLFGKLIGYGYSPLRLCAWMLGVWLTCSVVYWVAALYGIMGPSNPLVFQNKEYLVCQNNWYLCEKLPEEYTGFSPLIYSLDVLLPVINLQQENDWAPLIPTPKQNWKEELLYNWTAKHLTRLVLWMEILFGWIASLLLVAVLTGLIKPKGD
jgi:hypothetical protein